MKSKRLQLDDLFSSAEQSQEVLLLEGKINQLTQEISQLRSAQGKESLALEEIKLQELRQELMGVGGMREIPVSQIKPNPQQPRQTFTRIGLQVLAKSLKDDGQQDPLVLIEVAPGDYVIFDGERRWRAATEFLGWETLKAVIVPEPDKLHRRVLIANLHREELNRLDMGEALIKEIQNTTKLTQAVIVKALKTVNRRLERRKQFHLISDLLTEDVEVQSQKLDELDLNETEYAILSVLLSLRFNPSTVASGAFAMIQLPHDLKKAIRDGLSCTHALSINKLNTKSLKCTEQEAEKIRATVLAQVLEQNLSVADTRILVSGYTSNKKTKSKFELIIEQIDSFQITTLGKSDKEKVKLALLKKLAELDKETHVQP